MQGSGGVPTACGSAATATPSDPTGANAGNLNRRFDETNSSLDVVERNVADLRERPGALARQALDLHEPAVIRPAGGRSASARRACSSSRTWWSA